MVRLGQSLSKPDPFSHRDLKFRTGPGSVHLQIMYIPMLNIRYQAFQHNPPGSSTLNTRVANKICLGRDQLQPFMCSRVLFRLWLVQPMSTHNWKGNALSLDSVEKLGNIFPITKRTSNIYLGYQLPTQSSLGMAGSHLIGTSLIRMWIRRIGPHPRFKTQIILSWSSNHNIICKSTPFKT